MEACEETLASISEDDALVNGLRSLKSTSSVPMLVLGRRSGRMIQ